jgi:hypothetical protein
MAVMPSQASFRKDDIKSLMEPIALPGIQSNGSHNIYFGYTHTERLSRTKLSETDAQAAAHTEGISPITHLMRVRACGPSCGCEGTAGRMAFGP